VTKRPRKTEDDRSAPLSGVERQRRYRAGRTMVSIDVSGTTSALIQDLRARTRLTTDQLLVLALERFRADPDSPRPVRAPPQRRG
jgi:formylmethanofuran dehydrogenase subunit B